LKELVIGDWRFLIERIVDGRWSIERVDDWNSSITNH